jgi:hypothetical protein
MPVLRIGEQYYGQGEPALNNEHVILIFTGHVFPLILLFLPPPPGA